MPTPKHLMSWRRRSMAAAFALIAASLSVPADARRVELEFDPDNFTNPLVIDNQFWPLVPGTTYVYRAETDDGCEVTRLTVTSETKLIPFGPGTGDDVLTRVVRETDSEGEDCDNLEVTETTDDWFAQDDDGNIWYFGEDTSDDEGEWQAGVDGAEPGIIMLASPRMGDQYQQEFAEDVAEDVGKVIGVNVWVTLRSEDAVEPREFRHCLKIRDTNPLEPGSVEHKFYCPAQNGFGGGLVAINELHGGTVRFELVDIVEP